MKVALKNITSTECVFAQVALIRALSSVSKKMAFEMFQVQVCFVAMGALVFSLGVLGSLGGRLACSRSWSARMRGQNTAPSLLSDDVDRLRLLVRKDRRVRVQRRMR